MKRLTILLLAVTLCYTAYTQTDSQKLLRQGVELHDLGKYKQALTKYDKVLKDSPDDIVALSEKALTLIAMKDFEYCFEVCEKAIKTNPDSDQLTNLYTCYANAMDMSGEPEKAIKIYDRGIKKFPDYYHLYFNKGVTEAGINEMTSSLESFEMAVKCNSEHASSHNAISALQYDNNAKIPSLLSLCRFYVIEPTSQRSYTNLDRLNSLLYGNISSSGKNGKVISLDIGSLDENENGENNFQSTELILSLTGLIDLEEITKEKLTERDLFYNQMKTVISSLEETQEGQKGFYWEYYVPYFIEMMEKDHLETFSYLVYASNPEKTSKKWIKNNEEAFAKFYKWDADYGW